MQTTPSSDFDVDQTVTAAEERAPYQSETDITEAFRALKRDETYQFDLPKTQPIETEPSPFLEAIGRAIGAVIEFLAPVLEVAFWVGLVLIAVLILYFVAREIMYARFPDRFTKTKDDAAQEKPFYKPQAEAARVLLETADKLAGQGRYDEAVHVLLYRSIQDIEINRPNSVKRSLTSREIAKLSILSPTARTAFSEVANIVENSFFGGQPIGEVQYNQARKAYVTFAAPEGWAG